VLEDDLLKAKNAPRGARRNAELLRRENLNFGMQLRRRRAATFISSMPD
jgi:hypothetical protein